MIRIKVCNTCKEEKHLSDYHSNGSGGLRGACKSCLKVKRIAKIENNPYDYRLYVMASSMLKRIKYCEDDKNKHLKCYKDNNIKCKLGDNVEEVKQVLDENFKGDIISIMNEGKTPSVDRVDSKKDYELGNIRIIDYVENSKLGFLSANQSKKKKVRAIFQNESYLDFDSLHDAERHLGLGRSSIARLIEKDGISRKEKIKFKYI